MAQGHADNAEVAADIQIEVVESEEDIAGAFDVSCKAFGQQIRDGIWIPMNPGWDTPEGRSQGAARMIGRWNATTRDHLARPNAIFVKATAPHDVRSNENQPSRKIVGIAIWLQASVVSGHGDPPTEDWSKALNMEKLHPGNKPEQQYLCDVMSSLSRQRIELVKKKAHVEPPSVMILDLCAVDPAYQGKGIGKQLAQWGIDEAKRRGGLECITEASVMGRRVYEKLGFRQEGPEIEYLVDKQWADRVRPSNIFMRTGA
ncbi:hypothetical protein QQS21_001224 [Conoideocrella luteorostrata]|uniref:N-acetyltransferase domain-containing protein n=1 Tax=Conoideocrella luteorostrata TaxID=1105319 RepID=A0AAJ0D0X1_9HYPO|nr:hypothetical protein QQS21_001224 [Conoideocrella luteorostrata]